jgi:hypothetical protein
MIGAEIAAELRSAIEAVVRNELGRFGIHDVEVIESEDAGGDPVIQVLVHYNDSESEPDPPVASEAITKLNNRLYELREPRFAYLRHMVPEAAPSPRRRS